MQIIHISTFEELHKALTDYVIRPVEKMRTFIEMQLLVQKLTRERGAEAACRLLTISRECLDYINTHNSGTQKHMLTLYNIYHTVEIKIDTIALEGN